jgi:hypothetical protein
MTGTSSRRQLHMNGGTTRHSVAAGAFLHEPSRGAARVCGEEAGSKALVRGTRSAYEAAKDGRGRVGVRSPKVIRNLWSYMRRICGAKVTRLTPGGLSVCLASCVKKRLRSSRKRSPGRSSGTTRQRSERRATRKQVQTREAARSTKGRQKAAESISCQRTATKEEHRELNRNGAFDE